MLWTVTDIDTDLITTEFLSQLIPSTAPIQWKNVDKVQWQLGESNVLLFSLFDISLYRMLQLWKVRRRQIQALLGKMNYFERYVKLEKLQPIILLELHVLLEDCL